MKNNIREILDETNISIVDEINIIEYIDELEKVKEDYIKSLDKLDVLENRNNKAIEYIEKALKDDNSEFMYMYEPKIILDILRGNNES